MSPKDLEVDFLHEIGSRMAAADPLHEVLDRVVAFVSGLMKCDSCFIYTLAEDKLILRASKNPHPDVVDRLSLPMGQGITGWVAQHLKPVAVPQNASEDPRFRTFQELPEDRFEAFLSVPLLCRGRVVGVINVQHRSTHEYSERETRLISTIGFLVGAEVELARLELENSRLFEQLETRKLVERAKGILQKATGKSEEETYLAIQQQSRQRRMSIKQMAEAIILSEEVRRSMPVQPADKLK